MTVIVARGEALTTTNAKLSFVHATRGPTGFTAGKLADIEVSLEYQVFDISTDEKRMTPSQVFPVTPGDKQAANLTTDRLGVGRYAATGWTVDAAAPIGRYEIRWFYTFQAGDAEVAERYTFDVIDSISSFQPGPTYCSPSDLRDEGLCGKTDAFMLNRIVLASRFIERITGRFFEPRYQGLNLDGKGGRMLLLDQPIVAIEEVLFETSPFLPSSQTIDPDLLRVYSRHLSQGLMLPDDRNDPKIELFHASEDIAAVAAFPFAFTRLQFPFGQQNIIVRGVFGYTDPDGSMQGSTPVPIQHVCKLLVLREQEKLTATTKRDDNLKRFRLKSEKTREQNYTLESLGAAKRYGLFTGDPEIDTTLAAYIRPPRLGAA